MYQYNNTKKGISYILRYNTLKLLPEVIHFSEYELVNHDENCIETVEHKYKFKKIVSKKEENLSIHEYYLKIMLEDKNPNDEFEHDLIVPDDIYFKFLTYNIINHEIHINMFDVSKLCQEVVEEKIRKQAPFVNENIKDFYIKISTRDSEYWQKTPDTFYGEEVVKTSNINRPYLIKKVLFTKIGKT